MVFLFTAYLFLLFDKIRVPSETDSCRSYPFFLPATPELDASPSPMRGVQIVDPRIRIFLAFAFLLHAVVSLARR